MEVMQILAMESFDSGSHRQFREVLTQHSGHHWHWITNDGTPWKWSMRLGGLLPLGNFPVPDLFFCTSLLDVAVARTQVEAKSEDASPRCCTCTRIKWNTPMTPNENRTGVMCISH